MNAIQKSGYLGELYADLGKSVVTLACRSHCEDGVNLAVDGLLLDTIFDELFGLYQQKDVPLSLDDDYGYDDTDMEMEMGSDDGEYSSLVINDKADEPARTPTPPSSDDASTPPSSEDVITPPSSIAGSQLCHFPIITAWRSKRRCRQGPVTKMTH